MGENECLGWFPRYTPSKPMCNDVGCATQVWNGSQRPNMDDYLKVREFIQPEGTEVIPKEEFMKELGVKPHEVKFDTPNCKVSYKDGMIVVDETPKGIIRTNISTNDADFKRLTEETAQQITKAFEDIRKAMDKDFPMAFAKRKARKHYKPKFTL